MQFGTSIARGIERGRTAILCSLALVVTVCGALGIAGLADLAASPKGRTLMERGTPRWLQSEDLHGDARRMQTSSDAGMQASSGACTFDNQWMSTKWAGLSMQEKSAWTTLGWVKEVWDASWGVAVVGVTTTTSTLPPTTTLFGLQATTVTTTSFVPMTEQTCWQDLSEDQKDSAVALGYSISRWRECKQQCPWPQGVPMDSATCLSKMLYLHGKFNQSSPWVNISAMKRANLVLLGWDPDGNSWRAGRKPASYGRPWSELTVRERESATFLGYNSKLWHNCEGVADSPCLDRLEYLETQQRSWVWEEVFPGIRELLTDLGWQSRTWFEGEIPAVMKAEWLGLTNMQRSSARILGYTQDTWRRCPDATCLDRFQYVNKRWLGIKWMEMKLSERRAWMLLGHSEALWNNQATSKIPPTMSQRWAELTPEQRLEANFLGHSEGTWQGCNTEWAGRNDTSNATTSDPSDAVRARMFIDRPYSEISGNVYGQQVANMPTSFIKVFESAVARALFCGNPPLSMNPATYIGTDGEPLCLQRTNYEKQKYRIRVLNVVEGSIVVDFFFVANATASEPTARMLFEALVRQIDAKLTSPICHDRYFGRFATKAVVTENKLSSLKWTEMQAALNFEPKRGHYNPGNMCLLTTDAKLGITDCGGSAATGLPRAFLSQGFAGLFWALLALSFTLLA